MITMNSKSNEPESLSRGKRVHKKIQKEWLEKANGAVKAEKSITKPSGRKGRMDIFVKSDGSLVAVVEIKASDWDTMTPTAIQLNIRRQARQIWDYIESQLMLEKDVSPGIIFPKSPQDPKRMNLIEHFFNKKGISVVWEDESIEERKARS